MNFKRAPFFAFAVLLAAPLCAQEAAPAAAEPKEDTALEAEIAYVEALVNYGYPDIAGPVIEATKKKWPASEARFFAIEIRGMLAMGQFDDAEKKIASLPDRKSTKYWAARLEMANNYFGRGQKPECMKIYDEFFKVFQKPPADIKRFYTDACYAYGQLLVGDRQYAKAALRYEQLLTQVTDEGWWCNTACETVDIYLRLAAEQAKDAKQKKALVATLNAADKIVGKLLWKNETQPLFFGRAVSMKAHVEQLRGDMTKATGIIDEYKDMLEAIHEQIVAADPDGKQGLLKQSPLPECLYLEAKMLWDEVQAEMKQKKRDDEKIKAYLFGPKKEGCKRDLMKGAFAMAQLVFLKYEVSSWAPAAGDLAQTIKDFTKRTYNKEVKTKVTPEQIAKVRAAQFKDAAEKHLAGQYKEAIDGYLAVLAKYPEYRESIPAIENVASDYLDLILETKDQKLKEEYRLNADAVEGYLAERFADAKDNLIMSEAGNAVIRLAAKEAEYKNPARADRLYTQFFLNYTRHTTAATLAATKAMEYQKAERYEDAFKFWQIISECYTNSPMYASSLAQLSYCSGKLGDKAAEIDYIKRYLPIETVKIRRLQAQFQLAQMYQKDGLAILADAATNSTPEAVAEAEKRGTLQIARAIKQFGGFKAAADEALKDPSTAKDDAEKYKMLREAALFMVGECWSRIKVPDEKKQAAYRANAAKGYEAYLAEYPSGKYAKGGYVKLGTIYTAMGDMEKSKSALDRLSEKYPDSDEAKNAKPRLAKNLIEMGMKKEGADIYAEMLRTDGSYTAGQFVAAGEALIEAKSWDLANQAFEKAIRLAGTNSLVTVAKARLGMARSSWKQNSLAEARESLDQFLQDPKMARLTMAADANFMLAEVSSEQGRVEKDATMRGKYFGAAIGAIKKVRQYWKQKPRWEQDLLDLMSGDVLVDRMTAEESMGLKEEAKETCGRAASTFQVFIQAHGVTDEHPLDKMAPGEVTNLERAYATMVPLFAKMGAEQADRVMKFGQEYLDLFPNGKHRTEISNCMNQAKADLPNAGKK